MDNFKAFVYRLKCAFLRSRTYTHKPTLAQLLADPFVYAALRLAWYQSRPHAAEVAWGQQGSRKQEQGGWIVWNRLTGRLRVVRVPGGSRDRLDHLREARPPGSPDQEVVAWFHTHPNTLREGYRPQPSPGDRYFTRIIAKVPCIIETHQGRRTIAYP